MFWAVLVVPTSWGAKERVAGVNETAGVVPTPVSVTSCVVPAFPELSEKVSWPVTVPVEEGEKVTPTVQAAPAVRMVGQSGVMANTPFAEMLDKVSGLPPKLLIVMDWAG